MKTIFSQAYRENTHSNFAFLTAMAPMAGSMLEGACFGDAACQKNRELQTQASLTNAQANLAATQVAAMSKQNEAAQNNVLLYVGIGFAIVVLILGSMFMLKKQ